MMVYAILKCILDAWHNMYGYYSNTECICQRWMWYLCILKWYWIFISLFNVYVLILYSINMKYFVPNIICWYIQEYIINISEYYNWFCCVFFIMVNDVINDIWYNGCDIYVY